MQNNQQPPLPEQQLLKLNVEAVTIEKLIQDGKIVSATYTRHSKINLSNYETTDVGWSYTIEYPKPEHDTAMPIILESLVSKAEDKIKRERAERLKKQTPTR